MNPTRSLPRVFVSHANADKEYVDEFVNSVLMRGAGLAVSDIFYTSAPDTGIRSGQNLIEVLRHEAGKSRLVIALVTPIYQTRPVCVAELGAAWAREVLLPLMAPEMTRSELEGVLPGMLIQSTDDKSALNDLADRIQELGFKLNARSWGVGLEKWKSFLRSNPNVVLKPSLPTAEQMNQLEKELDSVRAALDESEENRKELQARIERLREAKSDWEFREADVPNNEREHFEVLRKAARMATKSMPKAVVDALWYKVSDRVMTMPNSMDDYYGQDSAVEQVEVGRLKYDDDSHELNVDEDYPDVGIASQAVEALASFLDESDRTEEFTLWFRSEFRVPMNLKKKGCWDALV